MMRKTIALLILIFMIEFTFSQQLPRYAENRLVIHFNEAVDLHYNKTTKVFDNDVLNSLNRKYELRTIVPTGNKREAKTYVLIFENNQPLQELITTYQSTGLFEYVEPDYIGKAAGKRSPSFIPSDEYFFRQYGLYNDGTFSLYPAVEDADIDMELGWDIEQGDPSLIVAVLDTGTRLEHPEFNGRIWVNDAETADDIDDDENGYIDDIYGWDFANEDNDPADDTGHGTNVAGIIAANGNNGIGYAGVDWNCKLMNLKVLNSEGYGYYSWWAEAIHYAVDHGAKVINMSLGGTSTSNNLSSAVQYAYENGVIIVAAMMNNNNDQIAYPAGYETTIAVGATNPDDTRSAPFFWSSDSGSNYGEHIDVVAPGNYIFGLNHESDTNYNYYWGGTSQAAPLVSGLSALLLAQDLTRTPDEIRNIIRNTAEDMVGNPDEDIPGFDIYYGYGRINAHQALLGTVSNTEHKVPKDLSVFPNPASDYIYVKTKFPLEEIYILNPQGEIISQHRNMTESELLKINVSQYPTGMYFIQIITGDKALYTQKIIITRKKK